MTFTLIIVLVTALVSCKPAEQNEEQNSAPEEQASAPSDLSLRENLFCTQGDWVYYSDYDSIYKVNKKSKKKTELCVDSSWWIQVDQDRIYYINVDDRHNIYSIKTNGTDRKMLTDNTSDGNYASKLYVADGWVYFMNEQLLKMRTDGSELTVIAERCRDMSLSGDWIYYLVRDMENSNYSYLYRIRKDGTDETRLTGICHNADYNDEWIYYSDIDNSGIYKMRFDGSEKQRLVAGTCGYQFKATEDWVYYTKGGLSGIIKVRTDGSEITMITKYGEHAMLCDIWEDHLIYNIYRLTSSSGRAWRYSVKISESDDSKPIIADIIESVTN